MASTKSSRSRVLNNTAAKSNNPKDSGNKLEENLNVFKSDNFDADGFVQSKCNSLNEKDVCMPVMDGLQATRLIRSFEETGNWDVAVKAGIEQFVPPNDQKFNLSKKRMPIIASKCREVITKKRKEKKRMVKFETSPMNVILEDKIYAHLTFANDSKCIDRECRRVFRK